MRMRLAWLVILGVVSNGAMAGLVSAEEAGAAGSQSKPATSSAPAGTAQPAKLMVASGSVAMIDLKATPPTLQIAAPDGSTKTLRLDPTHTSVSEAGKLMTLTDVAVGQTVNVRYAAQPGQELARSIQITTPAAPPTKAPAQSGAPH